MKFKVIVNPFIHEAIISTKIENTEYSRTIYYEDNDEWTSFIFNDKIFDIHFLYDTEFTVSIYPVIDNKVNYEVNYDVELTIKLTDL